MTNRYLVRPPLAGSRSVFLDVPDRIREANPPFITAEIVKRFADRVNAAAPKKHRSDAALVGGRNRMEHGTTRWSALIDPIDHQRVKMQIQICG